MSAADSYDPRYEKTISHFLPLAAIAVEECDRYYREVHTRFARNFLRRMDHVISYHIYRAQTQYDVNADWRRRPQAFRFIILRFQPGRAFEARTPLRDRIVEDHRNFLRELRSFQVREEEVVDHLSGQTALVKYLFELDRPADVPREQASPHLDDQVARLTSLAEDAFGLRLLLVNHVLSEGATEPVDEPGQRPLDTSMPDTTRQAFLELYFDQREWAEDWFARPAVHATLIDPFWSSVRGYRVDEECGLDRR